MPLPLAALFDDEPIAESSCMAYRLRGAVAALGGALRKVIGHVRSTGLVTDMTKVSVVIEKTVVRNRLYFVLTAFPIP